MQGVLLFANDDESANKRRKAPRACQRCKDSKKRCMVIEGSSPFRCRRCVEDGWTCSFTSPELPSSSHSGGDHASHANNNAAVGSPSSSRPPTAADSSSVASSRPPHTPSLASSLTKNRPTRFDASADGAGMSQTTRATTSAAQESPPLMSTQVGHNPDVVAPSTSNGPRSELRYANMLSLLDKKDASQVPRGQSTKLIAGTNPLSALLGKDLKHKIVTNSCSFRTPDPANTARQPTLMRGSGIHSCDWEQSYRSMGLPEPRLQYLKAIDCFRLPNPARCAELLEIFFSYVHPMVPIIDRRDFLSRYYGGDEPPSLVILHAVFLSASRYAHDSGNLVDGVSEVRSMCDELHNKLKALIEAEITSDRIAVTQASLLASLHWEGREGLNSAIDNLSIAVRACQEMGLHRKQQEHVPTEGQHALQRRIWWCLYAMDRFNAAQEGTPFLINELDCDVDLLTSQDVADEDQLTQSVVILNLTLSRLVEDAIRSLYMPGEDHTTLFTSRGALLRQRLDLQLEQFAQLITKTLMGSNEPEDPSSGEPHDRYSLFGSILLTHLDAVRILVHRPFLLYPEPQSLGVYASRDACRVHALGIVSRLQNLLDHGQLRYSWPFTVYAVVNSLLIFWYDISTPPSQDPAALSAARQTYALVVQLLRSMGATWWAASAKYRLAQALARAADEVHLKKPRAVPATVPGDSSSNGIHVAQGGHPLTPASATTATQDQSYYGAGEWPDVDIFADCDLNDYWASLGLDFDLDVASNIFSISDFPGP